MSTSPPTYEDVINKARELRRKLFKAIAYDVIATVAKTLSSSVSGHLREGSSTVVVDKNIDGFAPLPAIRYTLRDPASDEALTDLQARTDSIPPIAIDVDEAIKRYIVSKTWRFARTSGAFAVIEWFENGARKTCVAYLEERGEVSNELQISPNDVAWMSYPYDHPPKVYQDEYGRQYYRIVAVGTSMLFMFRNGSAVYGSYDGDAPPGDVMIHVIVGRAVGYFDQNDNLIADMGALISIYNGSTTELNVRIIYPRSIRAPQYMTHVAFSTVIDLIAYSQAVPV